MPVSKNSQLTRIGVFYDGNYFLHVSNYYNYNHPRRSRISISGLHQFIRNQVAEEEDTDVRLCQIVDAHYFRGRLSAQEASQKGNQLYFERVFDDILMSEGVTTHYLPVRSGFNSKQEKGIDVWLALESFELASYNKFDVIVLITADGDYVSLVRKLNTLGVRVMVLSWDFEYTNDEGIKVTTRTSQDLLEEVTFPLAMHEMIENRLKKNDPFINNIFVQSVQREYVRPVTTPVSSDAQVSSIYSIKNGYGFIRFAPNNLFFHYTSLIDTDFNELQVGDQVSFTLDTNDRGEYVAKNVQLLV
ncbi:MAG: NYN domain-containing protein [Spirosomataceae bacterium]